MTVGELIEELKKFPQDMDVYMNGWGSGEDYLLDPGPELEKVIKWRNGGYPEVYSEGEYKMGEYMVRKYAHRGPEVITAVVL